LGVASFPKTTPMSTRWTPSILFVMLLAVACTGSPATETPLPASTAPALPSATPAPTAMPTEPTELKVLFAGSLIIPFEAVERAFEAHYPGVDVLMEGHGSIQVIRHITELGDLVDVAALADYALVPMMMYQKQNPETGEPFADWYVEFATNRMVLAYTDESAYADEITVENWPQILARRDVRFGLSDPRMDAAGYRALMVLQLAENYFHQITLFENVLMGRFTYAIQTLDEDGLTVIRVPEILQTKKDVNVLMRSYSVQLIALLESGEIDYAFEYETVARQHNLRYLELPDEIDLGSEPHNAEYQAVQVRLDFQRYASVPPVFAGEVIGYGLTTPKNAPHPDWAAKFIAFLLGPEGKQVMEASGHPLFDQPRADILVGLPDEVRALCVPRE
jgi:molybdate/tungstate transport system substrate-binding protein